MASHDIDFRIKEEKERRAFPEFAPGPVSPPDSAYAAWNYRDRIEAIEAAELALAKGCSSWARSIHIATLGGLTPEQARADAFAMFVQTYKSAVASERLAA